MHKLHGEHGFSVWIIHCGGRNGTPPPPDPAEDINKWHTFHPIDSFDIDNIDDN